jgi:hypothetical protein
MHHHPCHACSITCHRLELPSIAPWLLQDPELWAAFEGECAVRLGVPPYPPPVCAALALCFDHFDCSKVGACLLSTLEGCWRW